jgi:tetratricopeptide (TPR) repeat protein
MKVALKIRWDEHTASEASAWLIPGRAAAAWLAELTRWELPLSDVRLLPVSSRGGELHGILAIPPAGASPKSAGLAAAYCRAGDQLFIPASAKFEPEITARELQDILPDDDNLYLWHPSAGLLKFGEENCLTVADLLRPPPMRASSWDAALPGVVLNSRLVSVALESLPGFDEIWEQTAGDIGSETPELKKLPKSPKEPMGGVGGKIGHSIQQGFAKMAKWFADNAPQNAAAPTWVNKLGDWANKQLNKLSESLMAARNREIARLLHMLETSPDEGLRYALPLGQDNHRGVGEAGGRLVDRDVNFSLKRLWGGGPADNWDLPHEYRQQLFARYRELANREIRLGRHRRAAYIFGELLGDFSSAAATLADGGHFQEAAVLYEEKLRNPREAARCLERGGLWAEAIERYEKLTEFEHIGQLYKRLEQPEKAEAAFRRAVAIRLEARDYCGAAELTEQQLHDPAEALVHYRSGWNDGVQGPKCFDESFRLLARNAWHSQALEIVKSLRHFPKSDQFVSVTIPHLAELATTYPEATLCATAADLTRILAAEQLATADLRESELLTAAVARLVPQDRLLGRDTRRFVTSKRTAASKYAPKPARSAGTCKLVTQFELPAAEWREATVCDDTIVAAGWRGRELIAVRANWEGAIHQPSRQPWQFAGGHNIILAADPQGTYPILVHATGQRAVPYPRLFPACQQFPEGLVLGGHPGLAQQTWAATYGARGTVCVLIGYVEGADVLLNVYAAADQSLVASSIVGLVSMQSLLDAMTESDEKIEGPWSLLVRDDAYYIAFGKWLIRMSLDGKHKEHSTVGRVIRSLSGSPRHTRGRLVAALDMGGMIQWTDHDSRQIIFADDMPEPAVGLTRGGWLVAATGDRIEVYSARSEKVTLHARAPGPGDRPIAILSGRYPDQFAVCTVSGKIQVFQVPAT